MNNEPKNNDSNEVNSVNEERGALINESEESEFSDPPTGGAGGGMVAAVNDPPTGGAGGGKRSDIEGLEE